MKTEESTDMVLLVTPSKILDDAEENRVLRIYFPETQGAWCKTNGQTLSDTAGVTTPVGVDIGNWVIDAALPGTLTGKCYQGAANGNDYIEITGIGVLSTVQSYGLKIPSHAQFKTGSATGANLISVQLSEGDHVESISFSINLDADQVTVSATVASVETITCSLVGASEPVSLGSLYKGAPYTTGGHSFTTDSSTGYYWAVYGEGNGTNAGLWKSPTTADILRSDDSDVDGKVDLITGEGFGMLVSSVTGTIPGKYTSSTPGIFGEIRRGFTNANLILSNTESSGGEKTSNVTLGARAGLDSEGGSYTETLTYICGGYIGGGEAILGFSCEDDFTDSRDSEVYPTVEIGTQCWMAKNLNYSGHTVGTSWCHSNQTSNCDTYGRLYNWSAAMDGDTGESSQGVCPEGWHLPSDSEQHTLDDYLATGTCNAGREGLYDCDPAGTKMKTATWGGDNSSGFSALPGGRRSTGGSFDFLGTHAHFWSSSPSSGDAWSRYLNSSEARVLRTANGQASGFSVRCLRD